MIFRFQSRDFNAMVAALKPALAKSDVRPSAMRIWYKFYNESGQPVVRFTATDGCRIHELSLVPHYIPDESGPSSGSFTPPRLNARSYVSLSAEPGRTLISFDEVTFETKAIPGDGGNSPAVEFLDKFRDSDHIHDKSRRSVCLSPNFLQEAAKMFKNAMFLRMDIGGPVDPVILTSSRPDQGCALILPRRTGIEDGVYRNQFNRTPWSKLPPEPTAGDGNADTPEYVVSMAVTGRVRLKVKAGNPEEALRKADEAFDGADLGDVDIIDADVDHIEDANGATIKPRNGGDD